MTKLSPVIVETLDRPISNKEWKETLNSLKGGRSPGPDGLTPAYYRCFKEILGQHFMEAYNALQNTTPCPLIDVSHIHFGYSKRRKGQ